MSAERDQLSVVSDSQEDSDGGSRDEKNVQDKGQNHELLQNDLCRLGHDSETTAQAPSTLHVMDSSSDDNDDNDTIDDQSSITKVKCPSQWPVPLQRLISEANDDDWKNVVERLGTHPEEANFIGKLFGQTPLHCACMRYPPLHAVTEILKLITEEVASHQNKAGESPLHLAASCASEEVQLALLEKAPQAVRMVDKYGDSPLHLAVKNGATLPLLERMVKASPATISKPNDKQRTPFSLLSRSYANVESLAELEGEDEEAEGDDCEEVESVGDWQAAKLFLYAACSHQLGGNYSNRVCCSTEEEPEQMCLVHAAAAVPATPSVLLRKLMKFYPNQATTYDAEGMTPLLLACKVDPLPLDEENEGADAQDPVDQQIGADEEEDTSDPLHLLQSESSNNVNKASLSYLEDIARRSTAPLTSAAAINAIQRESVVNRLVQWNPRAARMTCRQGRLPLSYALESGKSWQDAIQALVLAAPLALEMRDIETGLYPFQIAASHCQDLETIYHLIRCCPHNVMMGCDHQSETESFCRSSKRAASSQCESCPATKKNRMGK